MYAHKRTVHYNYYYYIIVNKIIMIMLLLFSIQWLYASYAIHISMERPFIHDVDFNDDE